MFVSLSVFNRLAPSTAVIFPFHQYIGLICAHAYLHHFTEKSLFYEKRDDDAFESNMCVCVYVFSCAQTV